VKQIDTNSTSQIVAPAETRYYGMNFSTDGSHIVFARSADETDTVRAFYRVPFFGGVPEKLLTDLDWCPAFSPRGDQITFVRNSASRNKSILMIANSDGATEREVAVRPLTEPYSFAAWSPDGQSIAASAGSTELGEASRVVVAVGVADGVEKTVTAHKWYWIDGVTWLADGSGLILAGNSNKSLANSQLWLLSCADGEARRITNDSNNYNYPIISSDSKVLIAGRVELQTHLFVAPAGDLARARRLTTGLGDYKDVNWTADGKLLVTAFENDHADIWLREVEGNSNRQLTSNAGTNWGQSTSPDNRYIVFDSDRTGDFHIWRMDSDGGNPVQLTKGGGEKFAKISPDEKSVVYTSFHDWTLWKISIDGGDPVQISKGYARESTISPNGKWIAYCTFAENRYRLALMPFTGGPPVKLFDLPSTAPLPQSFRWSTDGLGVLFIASPEGVATSGSSLSWAARRIW
jgi:Tol biopolymer transport system component